ncbi:PIN domain-containing protein [Aeromonas veronii]|uniref:PIN domain-containing protein n=1 Tax=Aeromonas veronii TaxID=654 RepID=UPI002B4A62E8|nr:PIN domain-containing protein [Aeromonas veronii]
MNIFIDTNIFFTFYNLSSENIDELKKILILHKERKLSLYLPELVVNEFWRNRSAEISRLITEFKKDLKIEMPQLVRDEKLSGELVEALRNINKIKSQISRELEEKILSEQLAADIAVKEIFEASKKIQKTDKIIYSGIMRYDLGNPPGKKNSYGDAINWESLLQAIPDGEDIHIISDDGDFYSPMSKERLNEYLLHEWVNKKKSNIFIYRRLSSFISNHFPEAKTSTDLELNIAIEKLNNSASFASTHEAISRLNKLNPYSQAQVVRIMEIYHNNDQVRWIATDEDVKSFGEKLINEYGGNIEKEALDKFNALINGK